MAYKKTHEDFIKKYKEKFPDSQIIFLEEYKGSKTPIKCKCGIHEKEWFVTPDSLYHQGAGCPLCRKEKIMHYHELNHNHEWFVDKFYKKFPNKPITLLSKYVSSHDKITCQCNIDNYIWETTPNSLLKGKGCPKCANRATRTAEELIKDFNEIYGGFYTIIEDSLKQYKNCHSVIQIQNIETGLIFSSTPEKLMENNIAMDILQKFGDGKIHNFNELLRLQLVPWKEASKKLYGGRCVLTNSTQNLVIHHLNKNFSEIRDEVFKENNVTTKTIKKLTVDEAQVIITKILDKHFYYGCGILLTKNLHDKFHCRYGKSNNTIEQFIEFAASEGYQVQLEQTKEGNKIVNKGLCYD